MKSLGLSLLLSLAASASVLAASNVPPRTALTRENIDIFCRALEQDIASGQPRPFQGRFDVDAMMDRVLQDSSMSGQTAASVKADIRSRMPDGPVGPQILKAVNEGATYAYLGLRKIDDMSVALFRLSGDEIGFNYHGLRLVSGAGGLRIVDVYIMTGGQWISESLRLTMQPAFRNATQRLADSIDGRRKAEVDGAFQTLEKTVKEMREGDPAKALALWKQLPPAFQNLKHVLVLGVMIAGNVSDAEQLTLANRLEKAFPGDPCLDLMLIDPLTVKKDYATLLRRVDNLDRKLGGDPYLGIYRAIALRGLERKEDADRALDAALKEAPGIEDLYWHRIAWARQDGDHARVVRLYDELSRRFELEIDFEALEKDEGFAGFVKSAEYAEWKKKTLEKRDAAPVP
jgi:hypothetical protein